MARLQREVKDTRNFDLNSTTIVGITWLVHGFLKQSLAESVTPQNHCQREQCIRQLKSRKPAGPDTIQKTLKNTRRGSSSALLPAETNCFSIDGYRPISS
jgi:hypothetical protein